MPQLERQPGGLDPGLEAFQPIVIDERAHSLLFREGGEHALESGRYAVLVDDGQDPGGPEGDDVAFCFRQQLDHLNPSRSKPRHFDYCPGF